MASEQEQLRQYQEVIRPQLDIYLSGVKKFLDTLNGISPYAPSSEREETTAEAWKQFYLDTKLPGRLEDFQKFIENIHSNYKELEVKTPVGTWSKLVDINNNLTPFFQEPSLSQPQNLDSLYKYLSSLTEGIADNIKILNEKIKKQSQSQQQELSTTAAALSQLTEEDAQAQAEQDTKSSEEIAKEVREKQQESLKQSKQAFKSRQMQLLSQINDLLPPGRKLGPVELQNLFNLAEVTSYSTLNLEDVFERYGIFEMIGKENTAALNQLKLVFPQLRLEQLASRKEQGLSTKVLPSEEAVTFTNKALGDSVAKYSFSATGRQLRELADTPEGAADPSVGQARRLREEFLRSAWEPEPGLKGLAGRITGQTLRRQEQLLIDWGVITREELNSPERPRLFEEFLGAVEDKSITDLMGSEDPGFTGGPTTEPAAQGEARTPNPAAAKRNLDRLRGMGQIARFAATNPVVLGTTAIGGMAAYGAIAQGAAGATGVLASAGAGALTGAAIGSFFPVIGTAAGALIGGVIGGAAGAGSIAISGSSSYAVSLGNGILGLGSAAPAISTAAGQGIIAATPTASAGISSGISGAAGLANAGISGTQTFLSSMQTLPSLFSSIGATTALVGGPIVVTGFITVSVVVPTILSSFLGPNNLVPGGTGRQCVGASWPTDGTIASIETYRNNATHTTLAGAAVPNYGLYKIPVYGGLPLPPKEGHHNSGSGVDIGNKIGTDIYSPYAGTGIAVNDTGPIQREDNSYTLAAYGNSIWIAAEDPELGRILLIFAHMSGFSKDIPVGTPFKVEANQFLGQMGSTGNSSAPHLHYEVVGIDKWTNIRSIVPNPNMEPGDKVVRDSCETSESGEIDGSIDIPAECKPVFNQETIEPTEVSVNFASSGCDRLANGANVYVNQLTQGFCGSYNQPKDKRLRSFIWNKSFFVEREGSFNFNTPGGDPRRYSDMAWCTSLIVEVYKANYFGPGSENFTAAKMGGVINMHANWAAATGRAPVRARETPISEVPLGSVLFYMNGNIFTHVGMVCSKTDTTLTSCESNAGVIHNTYETDENGIIKNQYGIVFYGLPPASLVCEEETKKPNNALCFDNDECQSDNCDTTVRTVDIPGIGVCRPQPIEDNTPPINGGPF